MKMPSASLRVLSLFAAMVLGACAQDVGLIDRTQPGAINKAVFEGEWYVQRTVVDAPYNVGYTFIGEQDELERVRFELTETHLVGWRSYDFIAGTDLDKSKRAQPGSKAHGAPVVAYEIVKHFDVKREYAASTGEQTNVLVENELDRPWYEREFVRVDWSKNLARNFMFTLDTIQTEPVQYAVTDPSHPDAMIFGSREGDPRKAEPTWKDTTNPTEIRDLASVDYFDVTGQIFATPEAYLFEDGTTAPVCWFYLNEDCQPAVITVRTAFQRIDPNDDYEPMDYPDNALARDEKGKIIQVKTYSDGKMQRTDEGSPVRIPWFDKFGYFRAERYAYVDGYGELESARQLLIARFNLWRRSKGDDGKAIPYAQREVRPIVYYTGPGFPDDLYDGAEKVVREWNGAFKETVAALQGKTDKAVPDVFVLRKNTLAVDAQGKLVSRGQRLGDLRYSLLNWAGKPTRAGLLGYGPASTDPLTGQIVQATANVYGPPIEHFATDGRDIVRLINGELDVEAYGLGAAAEAAVQEMKAAASKPVQAALTMGDARAFAKAHTSRDKQKAVHAMKAKMKGRENWPAARMNQLEDTLIEDLLINRDIAVAFGAKTDVAQWKDLAPGSPIPALTDAQKSRLSPRGWASPASRTRAKMRERWLYKHHITHAAFADDAVQGLASELSNKTGDEAYEILRAAVFNSTAEHEIGHTLGLRHNFDASTDALNFHPEYWKLRGATPKPLEPQTADQIAGKMREYQYSSIMDYGAKFNSDIQGLGPYDRAAIKFGYGKLVEVFDFGGADPADPIVRWVTDKRAYADAHRLGIGGALRTVRHYTDIPKMLGGLDKIGARKTIPYDQIIDQLTAKGSDDKKQVEATLWEVPYRFCSDEYLDGNSTCYAWDQGADPFEIVKHALDTWRHYYVAQAFRRDRVNFEEGAYYERVWSRYFLPVALQYQNWLFDMWDPDRPDTNPGYIWWTLTADKDTAEFFGLAPDSAWEQEGPGGVATAAVKYGINALAEVLATPEPGLYCLDEETSRYYNYGPYVKGVKTCPKPLGCSSQANCVDLAIPLGTGRYAYTEYDNATGYYFYERLRHIGTFYDKLAALEVLTDPTTYFIGVDTTLDVRNYILSMYIYFPKELNRLFGALAGDRLEDYAGVGKGGAYVPRDFFGDGSDTKDLKPVPTAGAFMIQNYALLFGMAWLNADWDQTFNDSMKIWLEGAGEAFTPAGKPEDVVSFTNPLNNRTYKASRLPDKTIYSGGAELLVDAGKAAKVWQADPTNVKQWALTDVVSIIEVVRGFYDLFGYALF